MKILLCLVLVFAGLSQIAVRADEGKLRAAVLTRTTTASLKLIPGKVQGARPTLEMGKVYEVAPAPGAMTGLKIDADRVALVPLSIIKTRECTSEEFASAQNKFNNTSFEEERKAVLETCKTKMDDLKKSTCATCPKVRAQAAARAREVQTTRDQQLREIERKKEALLQEALAWVAAK